MNIKTVDAIVGREEMIIASYGLPQINNRHYNGECPLCGKLKKFRMTRSASGVNWICVCGNGSLFNLIMDITGKNFATIAKEIDNLIGNTSYKSEQNASPEMALKDRHMNRFSAINKIKNTPVETYLKRRGIYELPQMSVKFSPSEYDHEYKRSFQAMYAVATDEEMNVVYAHKTYLENGSKANVEKVKKMKTINKYNMPCKTCNHEHAANVAVRMFQPDKILGIAEGIETALSAYQLYKVPSWAVLNTSIMKAFKAPAGIETLVIYADNDRNGAGLAAALHCGHKNILANNDIKKVVIRMPDRKGADFNDMLHEPIETQDFILT